MLLSEFDFEIVYSDANLITFLMPCQEPIVQVVMILLSMKFSNHCIIQEYLERVNSDADEALA